MKKVCRCGLGQTAAKSMQMCIQNFPEVFAQAESNKDKTETGFSLQDAIVDASRATDRTVTSIPEADQK